MNAFFIFSNESAKHSFCDTIRTNLLFIYQQYNILFCKESRKDSVENMIFPRSICSGIVQYRNKFKKGRTFKGLFLVFCGGTWYDKNSI